VIVGAWNNEGGGVRSLGRLQERSQLLMPILLSRVRRSINSAYPSPEATSMGMALVVI
jgi:hypothetical protein